MLVQGTHRLEHYIRCLFLALLTFTPTPHINFACTIGSIRGPWILYPVLRLRATFFALSALEQSHLLDDIFNLRATDKGKGFTVAIGIVFELSDLALPIFP